MMRVAIFLFASFFSLALWAQDTINKADGQGKKHGYWRKTDSAGKVIYEGRFLHGIPAGEFRYFYPDGKVKTISLVSDNGRKAQTTSFFPNGKKMAEGRYLNEKKDSIWQFYSESTGSIVTRESYMAGLINGLSEVFFSEGGLSEKQAYKEGKKDGVWEQYYSDGKLKLRGYYRAGDKVGPFIANDLMGRIMVSGQYSDGHQDGTWTYFDEKGKITKMEYYRAGLLDRTETPGK
jgi:antitoxin component YwqK of YwqJK toxin-antitoxin module